jgi:hypothetical protein
MASQLTQIDCGFSNSLPGSANNLLDIILSLQSVPLYCVVCGYASVLFVFASILLLLCFSSCVVV